MVCHYFDSDDCWALVRSEAMANRLKASAVLTRANFPKRIVLFCNAVFSNGRRRRAVAGRPGEPHGSLHLLQGAPRVQARGASRQAGGVPQPGGSLLWPAQPEQSGGLQSAAGKVRAPSGDPRGHPPGKSNEAASRLEPTVTRGSRAVSRSEPTKWFRGSLEGV
eukprot:1190629-Prorocentrum_minimum.AAC.5